MYSTRVSSTSANPQRRRPQQARAAQRRAKFLEIAARLIGEVGLQTVTMTAIAEQAKASIGTLYDYFPDKQAIAVALLNQYAEESDAHWAAFLSAPFVKTGPALAELFIDGVLAFVQPRPAYLFLIEAPVGFSRSAAARRPLRLTIAKALQAIAPATTADQAFLSAQVIVALIKGLISVYKQAVPKDKHLVTEQFKGLMKHYLAEVLS